MPKRWTDYLELRPGWAGWKKFQTSSGEDNQEIMPKRGAVSAVWWSFTADHTFI